ncbi:MAG: transposase [Armatimonadetes bacterium]|nr:transposase [Armatimonadota bacterium]
MSPDHVRGWTSRGYLPHFDGGAVAQFITYRLYGTVPTSLIEQWKEAAAANPSGPRNLVARNIEAYADANCGSALLSDPALARIVECGLLQYDAVRYHLHAWVVMPNHIHALITPMPEVSLSTIIRAWKVASARSINAVLERSGSIWAPDYFDRFIRDERHMASTIAYIDRNPVKAGLCCVPEEWPFGSCARLHAEQSYPRDTPVP